MAGGVWLEGCLEGVLEVAVEGWMEGDCLMLDGRIT